MSLLESIESGEGVGERIEALVAAVLDGPAVRLALAAREGGPFRVRRAIELAGLVLEGCAHAEAGSRRTG